MSSKSESLPDPQHKAKGGRHVTTACLGCRKRKIKCDGVAPRCSNCILYGQECVFQHGVDKRKIAPKERLQALTAYCQQIESLLIASGIPLPTPPPLHVQSSYGESQPAPAWPTDASLTTSLPGTTQPEFGVSEWQGGPNGGSAPFMADDSHIDDYFFYSESSPEQPLNEKPNRAASPTANQDSESEVFLDQLSGRMGSLQIAEDGQLRFYGATSNLHILHNGPLSLSRSKFRSASEEGTDLLCKAGVGHFVDEAIEDHLLKLYLVWEDPSIHVVEEAIFWRERRKCKTDNQVSSLYSEVLANAMCSIGATLTSRRYPNLPDQLPDFFATRAKVLLELEMDAPTLSTVQSLVILSAIEAVLTRDARGWLDSGMAVRLAVDLGLHLDPEPYVRAGLISQEEGMIRKVIWGGVFTHDRMWSLYVGRPVALDEKNITVRFSDWESNAGQVQKYWSPYDDSEGNDLPQFLDSIDELSIWNIRLCAHMTAIRETIYSDGMTEPKSPRELYDFVRRMRYNLKTWLENLPLSLAIKDLEQHPCLPHVLQLHMQYHCVMIITCRPFFASIKTLPTLTVAEIADIRNQCTESANVVAKLLDAYRRQYTLRRINVQAVHLVFTATLIHVFTACGAMDRSRSEKAWKNLEICCQALSEMGLVFKNASRALEVIMGIKSDLLRRSRSNTKRKIPWNDASETGPVPSKKPRSTTAEGELLQIYQSPQDSDGSGFDPSLTHEDQAFNFFDTAYDDFSLDTLFWTEFNALELPHLPPEDS